MKRALPYTTVIILTVIVYSACLRTYLQRYFVNVSRSNGRNLLDSMARGCWCSTNRLIDFKKQCFVKKKNHISGVKILRFNNNNDHRRRRMIKRYANHQKKKRLLLRLVIWTSKSLKTFVTAAEKNDSKIIFIRSGWVLKKKKKKEQWTQNVFLEKPLSAAALKIKTVKRGVNPETKICLGGFLRFLGKRKKRFLSPKRRRSVYFFFFFVSSQ